MEFIKAEEFLGQPVEVQKVLKEWWLEKFNFGNLCYNNRYEKCVLINKWQYNFSCISSCLEGECIIPFDDVTPLFTEGQLRQFIEDKLQSKLDIVYVSKELVENEESYYRIERSYFKDDMNNFFNTETDNLLQAYWKVAIQIAKEGANE